MLARDPLIVGEFPHYLPSAEELALAEELLGEKPELKQVFDEHIRIGGDTIAALRRFCWQARQENLEGAECAERAIVLLGVAADLRHRLSLDAIIERPPFDESFWDLFLRTVPVTLHGTDRGGHPLVVIRAGQIDVEAMVALWSQGEAMAVGDVNGTVLAFLRITEVLTRRWMARESGLRGETVDRSLFVYDFADFGTSHIRPLKNLLGTASGKMITLYPETVNRTLAVNVGWAISRLVWPLVRPFLHPVSQKKISVLDSGSSREGLLQEVDEHMLPMFLGGSCCCEECTSGRLVGGALPRLLAAGAEAEAAAEDVFHDAEDEGADAT